VIIPRCGPEPNAFCMYSSLVCKDQCELKRRREIYMNLEYDKELAWFRDQIATQFPLYGYQDLEQSINKSSIIDRFVDSLQISTWISPRYRMYAYIPPGLPNWPVPFINGIASDKRWYGIGWPPGFETKAKIDYMAAIRELVEGTR